MPRSDSRQTDSTTLREYQNNEGGDKSSSEGSSSQSVTSRLLEAVTSTRGLQVIPGHGDPRYLQNRGIRRCLFQDEHGRWFVLMPSATGGTDKWVKWVYLPPDYPEEIVSTGRERRTHIGFDYVHRDGVPAPSKITVTGMYVGRRFSGSTYECGSCEIVFEEAIEHARHCWNEHPTVDLPKQLRLRHDPEN